MSQRPKKPDLKEIPVDFDPFATGEVTSLVPMTEPQLEIWAAVQMAKEASLAFNESVSITLKGSIDLTVLRTALDQLTERHEALRATISGDGRMLAILSDICVAPRFHDFSTLAGHQVEKAVANARELVVTEEFDLTKGPLVRFDIIKKHQTEHLVFITVHHVIADGWSLAVLVRDLGVLYSAGLAANDVMLPAAPSFSAYALEQQALYRDPAYQKSQTYWQERFGREVPVLDLPTDYKRPPQRSFAAARIDCALPPDLVQSLKKTGARHGASFVVTLLAAFKVWLFRLSGETDTVVGVPVAGQAAFGRHDLVGHCVNVLPLRSSIAPEKPFAMFLQQMRQIMLDAYEHQHLTFGALLKHLNIPRDPSRIPVMPVMFNIDQKLAEQDMPFSGLTVDYASNPRAFDNFEIFINAAEFRGQVVLECQYNTGLFREESMSRYLDGLVNILHGIVKNPEQPVTSLQLLAPAAARKLIEDLNQNRADFPGPLTIHDMFAAQASKTPENVALLFADEILTYAELDERANQVAHHLQASGVAKGELVGLLCERSLDMVIGALGILKAGAAYVPIDPTFPLERTAMLLADAGIKQAITQGFLKNSLPTSLSCLCLDDDLPTLSRYAKEPVGVEVSGEDLAYVIYTSGSTGKPKGVKVHHGAVANVLKSMAITPGMTAADTGLAVVTMSFDISVTEIFLPLTVGARLVIASKEMTRDPSLLKSAISQHKVTLMQATPATWMMLIYAGWQGEADLRAVSGGEALSSELANELGARVKELWNMYGPTETTVWTTAFLVKDAAVLIGKPITNARVYVLDGNGKPVPCGVTGELYIAGVGVAKGYLNEPQLTVQRFLPDPFQDGATAMMYRTGDLVRLVSGGNLEYLGRNDNQVKIRGYRLETGEIEAILREHKSIAEAAVVVSEVRGDKRLVAYVALKKDHAFDTGALVSHQKKSLPDYMVCRQLFCLPELPRLPNGKLDRKALPSQDSVQQAEKVYKAPSTATENVIAAVWRELLALEKIGVEQNFFNLGGHSLLATRAVGKIKLRLNVDLGLRDFLAAPTISGLAAKVDDLAGKVVAPIPRRNQAELPRLSLTQERLWIYEQLTPGTTVNNVPGGRHLKGPMDYEAFKKALNAFINRHASLRTCVGMHADKAVQLTKPAFDYELPIIDLTGFPEADREALLTARIHHETSVAFDLSKPPLFKFMLFKLADDHHALFYMFHHLIWDGWCFDIMLKEMASLYQAFATCAPARDLPELSLEYADFSCWYRDYASGDIRDKQLGYWQENLQGPLPILDLPSDKPRPAVMSHAGGRHTFTLPKHLIDGLGRLAQEEEATTFMALLAVFKTLLFHYCRQDDIIVGSPLQGRIRPEVENMVGYFVNTLVFRTRFKGNWTFRELLRQVAKVSVAAFSNQDLPFEMLLEHLNPPRDPSRPALFSILFSYQDVACRPLKWHKLHLSQLHVKHDSVTTDLNLWLRKSEYGVDAGFDYRVDLFKPASIARLSQHFTAFMEQAVALPDGKISEFTWPETCEPLQGETRPAANDWLHSFEEHLASDEAAAAIVDAAGSHSRATLARYGRKVAAYLKGLNLPAGTSLCLYLPKDFTAVASILGGMMAGIPIHALDANDPETDLMEHLLATAPGCVISLQRYGEALGGFAGRIIMIDSMSWQDITESPRPLAKKGAVTWLENGTLHRATSSEVNQAVCGFLSQDWLRTGDRYLVWDSLSHKATLFEVLAVLASGATLHFANEKLNAALSPLRDITGVRLTPTLASEVLLAGGAFSGLKLFVSGEWLSRSLAHKLGRKVGLLTVLWEMPGAFGHFAWSAAGGGLKPNDGWRIQLLNPEGNAVPLGLAAEIYAANGDKEPRPAGIIAQGEGSRLVPVSLKKQKWQRGSFHLDLGQLQNFVESHDKIRRAVIQTNEGKILVHAVLQPACTLSLKELHAYLKDKLPGYYTIDGLVCYEALPKTPHGSANAAKFAPVIEGDKAGSDFLAPRTYAERRLAAIWCEVLAVEQVGLDDNFFNLGGYSLLPLLVINKVFEETGVRPGLRHFLTGTLEQIAPHCGFQESNPGHGGYLPAVGNSVEESENLPQPFFFGRSNEKLFGVYTSAEPGIVRESAVLLCYPGPEEYMRSHWPFRRLESLLSKEGYHVLRFDYFATGDSAGESHLATPSRWLEDIDEAVQTLKKISGCEHITLVGLRLGAALAVAYAASQKSSTKQLVLWDPVSKGSDYLRQMQRLHSEMVKFEPHLPPFASRNSLKGFSESSGFPMSKEMKAEIAQFDLAKFKTLPAQRTLILTSRCTAAYELCYRDLQAITSNVELQVLNDAGDWGDHRKLRASFFPDKMLRAIVSYLTGKKT